MLTRSNSFRLAALTGALLIAAACGGSGNSDGGMNSPPPAANTVNATPSLAFSPSSLTVHAGDEVTFVFGSVGHNVFFDPVAGAPADIPGTNAGVSVARTFTTAGTFPYNCHIHPGMSGTIVVQ